jgi:hypothetical protein
VGEHGKYTAIVRSSTEINMYYHTGPEEVKLIHCKAACTLTSSVAWIKHISLCHSTDSSRVFICYYLSVAAFSIFGGIWLFYVLVEYPCFSLSVSSGDNMLVVVSCP